MTQHLPVLLVVVPLIAAPIAALLNRPRLSWGVALLSCWWCLYAAVSLLAQTTAEGEIHYALGGWTAPYGIEYVVDTVGAWVAVIVSVDTVGAWVAVIVSLIGAVSIVYAWTSVAREVSEDRIPLFYTAFLLCISGLLGIAVTGDVFNVFVFLEISSLSAYALIALGEDRRALTASYQYLIMGSVGATFIVGPSPSRSRS